MPNIGFFTKEIKEKAEDSGKYKGTYLRNRNRNVYMRGDWQSELYFKGVKDDIKSSFTFRDKLSVNAQAIYNEIISASDSVTIHCRRGDYVGLGICVPVSYYINAMEKISTLIDKPIFYCFSDDIEWARQAFSDIDFDIRYPDYESPDKDIEDFRLISAGKNQILSNSSYSWWAAYLNGNENKKVICPSMSIGMWSGDFWLSDWIQISC